MDKNKNKNDIEILGKDNKLDKNIKPKGKGLINANTTVNVNTADVDLKMDDNTKQVALTGIICNNIIKEMIYKSSREHL